MRDIETREGYRKWALEEHPSVIQALSEGKATMTKAPDGFMWFGDERGVIEISPFFFSYATATGEEQTAERWPLHVTFEPYSLEYCGLSENGLPQYRRMDARRSSS